ncbi:MAG: hypothetical protein ACRBHB_19490 [Arenicella sp.]
MKKQNYQSAIVILTLSVICFCTGIWAGSKKLSETEKSYLLLAKDFASQPIFQANINLDLLTLLEEKNYDQLRKILILDIKHQTEPQEFDEHWNLVEKRNRLFLKAKNFKEKYCSNDCFEIKL